MGSLLHSLRYLPRYRRIAAVLARHALGWLADRIGLSRLFHWPRRLLRREPAPPCLTPAQRLCRAIQELGPSFVLLGRYLSTRVDLLPALLCRELAGLPSAPPPMPSEEVARILQEEMGRPSDDLFATLEAKPWRCTWLEQVHHARTSAGREVWVAVPNVAVRARLERDRPLLRELAPWLVRRFPRGRGEAATTIGQDFYEALRQEMDARERGHNLEHFRDRFAAAGGPSFPEVDWERTTARVLTCQALSGRPLPEVAVAQPGQHPTLARALYRFFGQAIFRDGCYPAPSALEGMLARPDGTLAVTLLAPVGHLDGRMRQALVGLLEHFQQEDLAGMAEEAFALGLFDRESGAAAYQSLRHLLDRYHDLTPAELRLAEVAEDLFILAGREVLQMPEEIALLLRTLVAVEKLGRRLSPDVTLAEEVAPLVAEAMADRHSWKARRERLLRSGQAWLEALQTLPVDARHLLNQAAQGNLRLAMEPHGWQKPMERLERMVHRLVLGVVTAGLLVAVALLITALLPSAGGPWGWILAGFALMSLGGTAFFLLLSFMRRR